MTHPAANSGQRSERELRSRLPSKAEQENLGSTIPRRSPEPSSTFEYRLAQEALNLRQQAKGMPPGIRRSELLRKARQIDVAGEVNKWLTSPGLLAPL
jgi:hypothetical protein